MTDKIRDQLWADTYAAGKAANRFAGNPAHEADMAVKAYDARLHAQVAALTAATAPTPAAQADSAPSPVGGYGLVDGAAICEAAAKKWEREAKRHKRAPGSLPSQHEARDLERARLCRNLAEKIRSTKPAHAADSVLEDAARLELERICAAIKAEDDYCVEHGDYMLDSDDCIKIVRGEWVRPDFSVDAARKQGGTHD